MDAPFRRLALAACLLGLSVGVSACGDDEPGVDEPAREGLALELDGVDYNVFITRQLNIKIPPDNAYYKGPDAPTGQTLYGVFLQACNKGKEPRRTTDRFAIVDNQGNRIEPRKLAPDNPFAYESRRLDPEQCIPRAGSVAQLGPTAGSMLLFQLPLQVTENRPLELEIEGATSAKKIRVELDI